MLLIVGDRDSIKISDFITKDLGEAGEMAVVDPQYTFDFYYGKINYYFGGDTSAAFANPFRNTLFRSSFDW